MKRPTMLIEAMLQDAALALDLAVERDVSAMRHRIEHEGLSFLTITLPILSDSLERGLENGLFSCPSNFARHGRLPRLLRGFFKRVFDVDGSLLDEPCVESIYWIRQICRFFKKPQIPCSPDREVEAIARFKRVEEELRHATDSVERVDPVLDRICSIIWSRVFMDFDPYNLHCRHGPGVTADRLSQNFRRDIKQWYTRSEESYPMADHAFHNYWEAAGYGYSAGVGGIQTIDLRDEHAVRVVFVPKTQTSPRVIAIEPHNVQYIQQSLARYMMDTIETHSLTKQSIRFRDQTFNQSLARSSSVDRKFSTLDLSDASDRVHLHLVQRMFRHSPILEYLEDARSLHADLPDGTNIILFKYASMGSALCFPVEACVFYALIQSAIHTYLGIQPTARSIRDLSSRIAVYGDDIIVPVEYTAVVSSYLESYALSVNSRKSFSRSLFRESCGGDYFSGVDVKPVYARKLLPETRRGWDPSALMSWTSTSNQLYNAGLWKSAQLIRDWISSDLRTIIPRSRQAGHGIYFASVLFDTNLGYDSSLCQFRQKRIVYTPQKLEDIIDGNASACFNSFFERSLNTTDSRRPIPGRAFSSSWGTGSSQPGMVIDPSEFSGECADDGTASESAIPAHWSDPVWESGTVDATYSGKTSSYPGASFGHGRTQHYAEFVRSETRLRHLGLRGTAPADFLKSTKRGAFKSKRQWITLNV
nr:MAG: hypothetical protein 3 [Leviviridae sp.]